MSNQNNDFNFEEFAVKSISYIDSIRSYQLDGVKPTESRINSFYRAIGLPAVVPEDEKELPNGKPDPINNGNVQELNFNTYKTPLDERQWLHDKKIDDHEIINFLDSNTQSFSASITGDRKRGVLFPMVVDGRIFIYPQLRRVGGAFMTNKQLRHSESLYKRPLIEAILLTKLKGQNVVDSDKQSKTTVAFGAENLELINKNANSRITQTLNTIVSVLENTCRTINRVRKNIGSNLLPTVENIAQQSPVITGNPERIGGLDKVEQELTSQKTLQNSVMSLFEFDDTVGSSTRNLRGEGLMEMFVEMLVSSSRSKRHTMRVDRRVEKAVAELKAAFRSLDLLLGTFSSLSGVDVMVVIAALYRLDPEYLVGLLNKESRERLETKKGNIPAISNAKGLTESLNKLETEVKKIFSELDVQSSVIGHKEKLRNQSSEEEK